jgi:predicted amidophosphoribosyltransferase
VAGSCPSCAAPHSRGALYCWQCGTTLMERQASSAYAEQHQATSVMDALLAHDGAAALESAASSDE